MIKCSLTLQIFQHQSITKPMKISIQIAILITLLLGFSLHAQIAPSPGAMGTINLSNSEDLYRAQVTEIVPIYTIEAENGYQVPIQLAYQTHGIKVDDVASSVGLGWDLVAGGAITRVMKDEPDDQSTFIEVPDATAVRHSEYDELAGNDFQRDIFYFSYPGGGGSFVNSGNNMNTNINGNNSFYGLPYIDVTVKFYRTNVTNSYWELTDTRGIVYRYGINQEARELTTTKTVEIGQSLKDNANFTYISTWYLEEIRFPNLPTASSIKFSYKKDDNFINDVSNTESIVFDLEPDKTYWYYTRVEGGESYTDYFTLRRQDRFASESYPYNVPNTGNVTEPGTGPFGPKVPGLYDYKVFEKPCEDNADPSQQECYQTYNGGSWTLHPYADNFIDNLILTGNTEGYSGDDFTTYKKSSNPSHSQKSFRTTTDIYTSSLVSIQSLKATVNFNNQSRLDYPGLSRIQNIVVYDHTDALVYDYELGQEYFDARDFHSDVAGLGDTYNKRLKLSYVNRNGQLYRSFNYINELDPSLELPAWGDIKQDKFGYYKSSVNSPFSPYTAKYGITDPFNFVYDIPLNYGSNRDPNEDARANMLWKVNYPTGGYKEFEYGIKAGGGVSISSIMAKNKNGDLVSHNSYTYDRARAMEAGLHAIGDNEVTFFSTSPYLTFDHQSLAGYRDVIVRNEITGTYTSYEFYFPAVNDLSEKSKWRLDGSSWTDLNDDKVTKGSAPMMSPPNVYQTGLPRFITSFDAEDAITSVTEYMYVDGEVDQTISEHAFLRSNQNSKDFYLGRSILELRPFYLEYIKQENFEGAESTITLTDYNYHNTYKSLISSTHTYTIDEEVNPVTDREVVNSKSYVYYPSDADAIVSFYGQESTMLNKLINKHMIGVPVATVSEVDLPNDGYDGYWVNGASFTKYTEQVVDALNTFLLPATQHQYIIDRPDAVWSSTFSSEIIQTSTYNDQGLLASRIGQDGILTSYLYDDEGYMSSVTVDPGVEALKTTTTYTYKPLVGLSSVTGPDGKTISYEYDDQNRLLLTRNFEGNILKRYRYNYHGDEENIVADIEITGTLKVGQTITLKATNVNLYGESDFIWTVDGITKTGRTITHNFLNAGSKNIKLNINSPEHETPFEAIETIYVYEPTSFTLIGPNNGCVFDDANGSTASTEYEFYLSNSGYPCTASVSWSYKAPGAGSYTNFDGGTTAESGVLSNSTLIQSGTYTIRAVVSGCHSETFTKTIFLDDCVGGSGGQGGGN